MVAIYICGHITKCRGFRKVWKKIKVGVIALGGGIVARRDKCAGRSKNSLFFYIQNVVEVMVLLGWQDSLEVCTLAVKLPCLGSNPGPAI